MYHCASRLILLRCVLSARRFLSQRPFLYMASHCHLISSPHGVPFESSRLLGALFQPGTRSSLVHAVYSGRLLRAVFCPTRPQVFCGKHRCDRGHHRGLSHHSRFRGLVGGHSFGPRILQFALPAVALLALLLVHAASLRGGRERIVVLALCGAIAGWEGSVHISGMTSSRGFAWNTRPVDVNLDQRPLWDWLDPQFLAAFRPMRPLGGIATIPYDGWVARWPPPARITIAERRHFRTRGRVSLDRWRLCRSSFYRDRGTVAVSH